MEKSIDFYRNALEMELAVPPFPLGGPEVEAVMGLSNVEVRTAIVRRGNLMLELFEFASPDPKDQDPNYSVANRGISHFGVTVPDIAETYERMVGLGVRFHSPVARFPSGVLATYGRDPDGNVFELLEMPKTPAA